MIHPSTLERCLKLLQPGIKWFELNCRLSQCGSSTNIYGKINHVCLKVQDDPMRDDKNVHQTTLCVKQDVALGEMPRI